MLNRPRLRTVPYLDVFCSFRHVGLKRGREWLEVEAGEEKAAPATGRTALGISRTRDDGVRCQQQGPRELGGETLDPGSDGVVPASALRGAHPDGVPIPAVFVWLIETLAVRTAGDACTTPNGRFWGCLI